MEVEDGLPRARPDVHEDAVVLEARAARGAATAGIRAALVVEEVADVAERVHVPLREDEQVRLRERRCIADRDEALLARDVVALGDEPTEEAVLRRRRQKSPSPESPTALATTSSPISASAGHGV